MMRAHPVRAVLLATAALALIALVAAAWHVRERREGFYTDGSTIRAPAEGTVPRDVLWQPAEALSTAINTNDDEREPRVTADGLTLLFVRGRAGENADLWTSTRTIDGWSEPEPLDAVNTQADELGPEPSSDGQALYFYSNRDGGLGGYDLWVARRDDGAWRNPVNLGPAVNTDRHEVGPALAPDGRRLYFTSSRPVDDRTPPNFDVFAAPVGADGVGEPTPLEALNTEHNESSPAISPSGDFIYFSSDRPGGHGGFDVFRARRLGDDYASPRNLGATVNSAANELDPGVDLGGFGLHFSTNRVTPEGGADSGAHYELYRTQSREVMLEEQTYRAQIDWVTILPIAVWVVAALLLLLTMLLLARFVPEQRFRQLSLIARCMIVSVVAHMLLMAGLAVWGVSTSLADWLDKGRGMQVALVTHRDGDDVASQVRGSLTTAEFQPAEVQAERVEPTIAVEIAQAQMTMPVERAQFEAPTEKLVTETTTDAPAPPVDQAPVNPELAPTEPTEMAVATPQDATPMTTEETPVQTTAAIQEPAVQRVAQVPDASGQPQPTFVEMTPVTVQPVPDATAAPLASRLETTDPVPAPTSIQAPTVDALPQSADTPDLPQLAEAQRSDAPEADTEITVVTGTTNPGRAETAVATAPPTTETVTANVAPAWRTLTPAAGAPSTVAEAPAPVAPIVATAPPALPDPDDAKIAPPQLTAAPSATNEAHTEIAPTEMAAHRSEPVMTATKTPTSSLQVETAPTGSAAPPPAALPLDLPPALSAAAPLTPTIPEVVELAQTPETLDVRLPTLGGPVSEDDSAEIEIVAAAPDSLRAPVELDQTASMVRVVVDMPDRGAAIEDLAAPLPLLDPDPVPPAIAPLLADLPPAPVELELPLPPAEVATVPFEHRRPERRAQLVEEMGGGRETERAVGLALDWLARHQSSDGHWDSDNYDDRCGRCVGRSTVQVDIATTGLSLLCFLGTNHTHTREGPYRETVERGLSWLISQQESSGALIGSESMYSHGIATIALAEAYGITQDETLRPALEDAIRLIISARNRRVGGWRYLPGQVGDTSVLGWQVMAMSAARHAGIEVPAEGFDAAREWLTVVEARQRPGLYGYQPRHPPSPAMTAEGLFVHQLLKDDPEETHQGVSAAYVLDHPPSWQGHANTYYWYYATLALFQHQGDEWKQWNERVKEELLANQVSLGRAAGSWPPDDKWARSGGRVYQTAICTLTLEVYYRYLPGFVTEEHAAVADEE
ncbi:MAG: hypothetical protein GY715_05220 [Planctomycetes bacterium]|nr:hypothetical protein [Planctomycetota bacterium]